MLCQQKLFLIIQTWQFVRWFSIAYLSTGIGHIEHGSCLFPVQCLQVLLCDWLLDIRAELWEINCKGGKTVHSASQTELIAFQQDLCSMRQLSRDSKAALPKVSCRGEGDKGNFRSLG